ncbi:MAG: Flp pilus assembly complex ATPase component TadA [Phycisphaeraceae bacterium]|nr:Flp pilus assembly complex ATPase component TadA [Phycisphaeraceae bacterium]
MSRKRRRLGEILQHWGLVDDQQLGESLKIAQGSHERIGDVLCELGYVKDTDVAKALASQSGLEYIDLNQPDAINKDNMSLLSVDLIKKYMVLPLEKVGNKIKVIVSDPLNLDTLDNLRFRTNCEIEIALSARSQIKEFLDEMFRETRESIDKAVREMTVDSSIDQAASMNSSMDISGLSIDSSGKSIDSSGKRIVEAAQAPVIRLVNQLIAQGVHSRASDNHIEPMANRVRLRYRIDGVCHDQDQIPKRTQSAVIARLKIMSGIRIEEKRVPQDGRIKLRLGDETVDFRVSCCPAYHGESVVLRILRSDAAMLGLEKLGLQPDTLATFNSVISKPTGIFLVTGPTGSGKTTTLYSALNILNRPDKKIITAEDPVEYNFPGINQCQVNEQIGLSFSKVLRAMLRQAPNVILVGEIRDKEVADVAIQAALTGHLVFSTLHTNDAPSAITRLIDMGVKPFLVASAIQAVLGQRLIRQLCDSCKAPDLNPNPKELAILEMTKEFIGDHTLYKPVGCEICGGSGFKGRRGIYEMMVINNEIRELAFKRAPVNQIRAAAIANGMRNLLGDGKLRILAGKTSASELVKIAQAEGVIEVDDDEAA